jgi:hypothetical protein
MKTPTDHYVTDVLFELVHRARAAREAVRVGEESGRSDRAEFEAGRAFAYYEVVSYMLQQLESFQLPRGHYDVPDAFDPDELLSP